MEVDGTIPRWTLRLSKEVEAINQAILEDLRCPFSSILQEENSIAFELTKTEMKIYFRFYITEDYPDHCLLNQRICLKVNNERNKFSGGDLMMSDNGYIQTGESTTYCDKGFIATFTDLAKKHYKQMRIPEVSYKRQLAAIVPEQISLSNSIGQQSSKNTDNKKCSDDDDDDDDDDGWDIVYEYDNDGDENVCTIQQDRKIIPNSTTMNLKFISDTHCTTPLNLDFDQIHSELKADLKSVEEQLSSDRVKYYTSRDNDVITIVLTLERSAQQNSGGNDTKKVDNNPIDIILLCHSSQYYNQEMTIKISQRSDGRSPAFRFHVTINEFLQILQIERNLETFLSLIEKDLKDFNKQKKRMDHASKNKNGPACKSSIAAYLDLLQQFICLYNINHYYHPMAETTNAATWSNPYNFVCDGGLIESLRYTPTFEFNKGLLLLLYQYASYRLLPALRVNAPVYPPASDVNLAYSGRTWPVLFDKGLFAFLNWTDVGGHDGIAWMKENPEVLELLIAVSKAAVAYYKICWRGKPCQVV